jgi:hypothetical protein
VTGNQAHREGMKGSGTVSRIETVPDPFGLISHRLHDHWFEKTMKKTNSADIRGN